MREAYETYYASSVYDERYPAPNRRTLRYILNRLPAEPSDVLDVGAGNGRYAIPLITATRHRIWAIERSPEARGQLLERGAAFIRSGRLQVLQELHDDQLREIHLGAALFLFGVLAHMSRDERELALGQLRGAAPRGFPLMGSVPNLRRRFSTEQQTATVDGPLALPRINYTRTFPPRSPETFEYTLFEPCSLHAELASLGWRVTDVTAESLLPESGVTRHASLGTIDRLLAPALPPITGYGLLFTATAARDIAPDSTYKR
jgi:SAM-dependent methyltransferase